MRACHRQSLKHMASFPLVHAAVVVVVLVVVLFVVVLGLPFRSVCVVYETVCDFARICL